MRPWGVLCLGLLLPVPGSASEPGVTVHGLLDARLGAPAATRGWLEGGLGKTRYGSTAARPDERSEFAALSQVSLVVEARASEVLGAHVQLNLDAEPERSIPGSPVGLVEAFARYAPEPAPWLRVQARAGMFFPPISFEHTGVAWSTEDTLTPSAINAWVGEEVRAIGAELRTSIRWGQHDVSAVGAVFGGNDPSGTLLAWRGWALHDRQTVAGERLPLAPAIPSLADGGLFDFAPAWAAPVREVDGRLGWYAGAGWRVVGRGEVRGLFLDNRADPTAFDGFQYGWHTAYWSAGGRFHLGPLEIKGQFMDGETAMGHEAGGRHMVDNAFRAWYGLANARRGRHRLTARYDAFRVDDLDLNQAEDRNAEEGHAWTAAYAVDAGASVRFIVEWLRVTSDRAVRVQIGEPARAVEDQVQVAFRFVF